MEKRTLKDFPTYTIYSDGKIYSENVKRFLVPALDKDGYEKITLIDCKGKKNYLRVHRVVALAFIENPDKLPFINHKDENKRNNSVSNLEWCSAKYNANYGTRLKRLRNKFRKPIDQYSIDGVFIKTWETIREAQEFYKNSGIDLCCQGKRKTACGYVWRYSNERLTNCK